ncbi:MAG: preprotein translocase subunit YajC [Chlamydia sp.]
MLKIVELFADAPAPVADQGLEQTLVMMGVAILFFYILIMRPENKRRKELESKRQGVQKGDRVVVAGGILGDVFRTTEDSVIISLHDGSKMEVLKIAVQDVKPTASPVEVLPKNS